jgi:hypothetical protein
LEKSKTGATFAALEAFANHCTKLGDLLVYSPATTHKLQRQSGYGITGDAIPRRT